MPFFIIGSINIFVSNNFSQIFWLKVPSCPIWKLWYTFQTTKITSLTFSTFFYNDCSMIFMTNATNGSRRIFVVLYQLVSRYWSEDGRDEKQVICLPSNLSQLYDDLTNLSNIYIRYPSPPRSHFIIRCSSKLRLGHTMEFKVGTLRRDP